MIPTARPSTVDASDFRVTLNTGELVTPLQLTVLGLADLGVFEDQGYDDAYVEITTTSTTSSCRVMTRPWG